MGVTNFNPDANPESTTVDGYTVDNLTSLSWTNLRNASGATASDSGATLVCGVTGGGAGPVWKGLNRVYLLFDFSLPTGATVLSAKIRLYVESKANALGNLSFVVATPTGIASNTAVATADHAIANWDFTNALSSTVAVDSISTSAYNDFTLSASGLALLTTGVVKFGLVLENDRANSAPAASDDNQATSITITSADGANAPILEVTHTDVTLGSPIFFT